jgi:hypothetical protein
MVETAQKDAIEVGLARLGALKGFGAGQHDEQRERTRVLQSPQREVQRAVGVL